MPPLPLLPRHAALSLLTPCQRAAAAFAATLRHCRRRCYCFSRLFISHAPALIFRHACRCHAYADLRHYLPQALPPPLLMTPAFAFSDISLTLSAASRHACADDFRYCLRRRHCCLFSFRYAAIDFHFRHFADAISPFIRLSFRFHAFRCRRCRRADEHFQDFRCCFRPFQLSLRHAFSFLPPVFRFRYFHASMLS
jgi:hypothetical protein